MAGRSKDNLFGLAAIADSEKDFKQELEQMAQEYYDYLITPLFATGDLRDDEEVPSVTVFSRELAKINGLVETGELHDTFIAEKIKDAASMPSIGMRQLPAMLTKSRAISEVYDLVLSNRDIQAWKKSGYDIILEIEIAQCRALLRYKKTLEVRIEKNIAKAKQHNEILSFKWLKDSNMLDRLYDALKNGEIIDCEIDDFRVAFNNSKLTGPPKIRWIMIARNKHISKAALFYLLRELAAKEYIQKRKFIKPIENIFCKKNGEAFENLGQSEGNPIKDSDKQRIDNIINSLK